MKFPRKLLKFVSRVVFGKEIALALTIIRLIASAFGKTAPGDLSAFVYRQLPNDWKAPQGPATEAKTMDMIVSGISFYRSVRRMVTT